MRQLTALVYLNQQVFVIYFKNIEVPDITRNIINYPQCSDVLPKDALPLAEKHKDANISRERQGDDAAEMSMI